MKTKLLLLLTSLFAITTFINAQSWSLNGNAGTNPPNNFLGTTDGKALVFKTNNIERMRIVKSGKIGIGTTDPQAKLHVVGDAYATLSTNGYLMLGNPNSSNLVFDYNVIQSRINGSSASLYLNYYGGAVWMGSHGSTLVPAIYASTGGSVAIGSSSVNSSYALTVNPATSQSGIYVSNPADGYSIYSVKSGSGKNAYFENSSSGTSDPTIYGINKGYGEGVFGAGSMAAGVRGYSSSSIGVYGMSGEYYGIYAKGGPGVYSAYINGDIYATGSYLGSDEKLKQNIHEFSSAVEILSQLHPKLYKYRQDGDYKLMNFPQGEHYGLIAQEVEKVLPGLVKETKFQTKLADPSEDAKSTKTIDFKAVNYTEFIPILIKAVQEQETVISKQQLQISQQQQQIDQLKQLVQSVVADQSSATRNSLGAYLLQNSPNPVNQNTNVRCFVPSSVKQAQLAVYNMNGQLLKSFTLNTGMNDVTITAGTLSSGQYSYSLLVDGRKVDSKNMTITK